VAAATLPETKIVFPCVDLLQPAYAWRVEKIRGDSHFVAFFHTDLSPFFEIGGFP